MKSGLFADEPLPPAARRAIFAGFVGFAVDFFDIYLPSLVLAPVMAYFEPKGLSSTATTTVYYFTIVATLLGRPCGAVIFGHWADKIGRRRTTMISIAGFGIFTALIAFIPGSARIGMWSLVLLIAIRFLGGIFMGGEYTSNNTLALEMVPKERRGFVGGLIQGAFPVGFAMTTVVTTIMLSLTTQQQYFNWGWRVPFFIGFGIAMAFLMYYRTVPESEMWEAAEKEEAPLKAVLSGRHLRTLAQIFVMMTGFWLVGQPSTLLPSIMIQQLHVPSKMTSNGFFFASVALFFGFMFYGLLSQMIGRRRTIVIGAAVVLVCCPALYYAMVTNALSGGSPLETTVFAGVFHMLAIAPWGAATVYICERFPTHVRASGYGIGYSLAVVIPSFSGIYVLWLGHIMPYLYAPIVLLIIAGFLMIVGALLGPETRDVELHLPDLGGEPLAAQARVSMPRSV
jgi:MFS family permease